MLRYRLAELWISDAWVSLSTLTKVRRIIIRTYQAAGTDLILVNWEVTAHRFILILLTVEQFLFLLLNICSSHCANTSVLFFGKAQLIPCHAWGVNTVDVLEDQWLVLIHEEACILEQLRIAVPHPRLMPTHSVIELVLQEYILQRVVSNEPWSKLVLVKVDEPIDEATVGPRAGSVCSKQVRGSTAAVVRYNWLLLVRVHDLLVVWVHSKTSHVWSMSLFDAWIY